MKKSKSLIIIFSIVLLIVIIGVSYAWLSSTIFGKKEYVLKAGELDLVLDESSNGLIIENEIPVTDEEGMASEGATFTVRNNGSSDICYQIYLDDSDLLEAEVRVEDRFVKYGIEKDNVVGSAKILSEGRMIDETEIRAGVSVNYRLKLWFNIEEDGEIAGQVFRGKLRIEAIQCNNNLPVMKVLNESEALYADEYKSKTTSIITKNNTMVPDNVIEHWDVSEKGDSSVIAYAIDDGSGGYTITIGGNKVVFGNQQSTWLFSNFTAVRSIDLSYFNTSRVKSMFSMFYGCTNLVELNISGFNTSNTVDMRSMFASCSSLKHLDLSHFDTSKVTMMSNMFERCSSLINLNISKFNTSNVTNIGSMFYGCIALVSLDLTSFDTSNMTEMGHVFTACRSLQQVVVSNGWTTSNASTTNMFLNCGCDHVSIV